MKLTYSVEFMDGSTQSGEVNAVSHIHATDKVERLIWPKEWAEINIPVKKPMGIAARWRGAQVLENMKALDPAN